MANVRRPRGDVRSVEAAFGQRCRFTALKRHVSGLTGTPPTQSRPRRFHGHVLRVSRCHVAGGPRRQRLSGILARRPRRTSALSAVTCRHRSSQTAENADLSTHSPSFPFAGPTARGRLLALLRRRRTVLSTATAELRRRSSETRWVFRSWDSLIYTRQSITAPIGTTGLGLTGLTVPYKNLYTC